MYLSMYVRIKLDGKVQCRINNERKTGVKSDQCKTERTKRSRCFNGHDRNRRERCNNNNKRSVQNK